MRLRDFGKPIAFLFVLTLALLLAMAAACGDDDDDNGDGGGSPTGDGAIDISDVPELEDGKLTVGSDIAYAPIEFYIEGTETPDGLDIDLAKALAQVLGVEVEFVNSGFDGLIGALGTEDFDVIMSAMTIDAERSQQIDFVPYVNVGTGVLVPAGNPNNIQSLEDLCGLTVSVQVGTIQVGLLDDASQNCDQEINIVTFDTNPLAVEDLRTGGADAELADFPVAFVDAEASEGDLEVLDVQIDPAPYGIGVRKDSTELKAVLEQALAAVKASGDYATILENWSLSDAALD
ncbi:MAG TPA: ABC transporter substrate-binding protein [Dehalococcoidia bacterium]|nr:ABC transporter substrate-binding protein [Dehalococcoidia bacterium]